MIDTRLQLHWAVQLLARFGDAHIPARADFGHSALTWDPVRRWLRTEEDDRGQRLAFDPVAFTYHLSTAGEPLFELRGATLNEALTWLSSYPGAGVGLEIGEPDIPPHAVSSGGRFDPNVEDLRSLADLFHRAHRTLIAVRQAHPHASPVRCWPHHLDIAVLIPLDGPDSDPEKARSVGVGMTPGDATFTEPYWYVTPWPYPAVSELPPLPSGGTWHTDGWIGAVLDGDAGAAGDEALTRFLAVGIEACKVLAGA